MEEKDPTTPSRPDREDSTTADESEERLAHYLRMLSDENPGNRWKAADSLGRLKDPRGTDPLIDALFDDDSRVRVKVAWALGSIGDPRALAPLRQLYRIENQDQQEIIGDAMATIKRKMSGE
jgi:HEAT repeat protein